MTHRKRRTGVRAIVAGSALAAVSVGGLWGWETPDGLSTATAAAPVTRAAAPIIPREGAREPVRVEPVPALRKAAREPARAEPAASAAVDPTPVRPSAPKMRGRAGAGPPLSIAIPGLGISQNLIGLRVARNGTLQVPEDPMDIGWWSSGPAPGEPGGAVVVGHNRWNGRAAIFDRLARLERGARIVVDRTDGSIATYRVSERRQFAKNDYPDDLVYRYTGPSTLHLVTCGGFFDSANRRWTDNVVVFADLVSDTRRAP